MVEKKRPPLPSHQRAVSAGMKRHWEDPEKAAKHRAAITGPQSEETRRKKSAAALEYWERRRAEEGWVTPFERTVAAAEEER